MLVIAPLFAGFVVGGIPFGYLLVRLLGRGDIREVGSGNIGATNVGRLLGPAGWTATLVLDAGKGIAGVALGGLIAGDAATVGAAAGAAGAVLGHCYTPWLRGRGGKGVATMLGAFGFLTPMATLIAVGSFAAVVLFTRWVSLSSLVAAVVLVIATVLRAEPTATAYAAGVVCFVVFLRHRENIQRLRGGTEAQIGGGGRD